MTTKAEISKAALVLGERGGLADNKDLEGSTQEALVSYAKILGSLGGRKGGPARAEKLSSKRRKDIATYASLCAKIKRNPRSLTPEQRNQFEEFKEMFSNE